MKEICRIRDRYARKFDYDLDAIFSDIQEKEKKSTKKFVRFRPKQSLKHTGS